MIDNFVRLETKILTTAENGLETTQYTGVEDFFINHLAATQFDEGLTGIDVFKIRVGDIFRLNPSDWNVNFTEKHGLPENNEHYQHDHIVRNVEIKYYTTDPISAEAQPGPVITIAIILERLS